MQPTELGVQRIEDRQDVYGSLEAELSKYQHWYILLDLQTEQYSYQIKI